MKNINIKWLESILDSHDKYDRFIPIESSAKECTQSIFINRYFRFLENRTFKLKIKGVIYYALFLKSRVKFVLTDYTSINYGVTKRLGYNSHEFTISFFDERLSRQSINLHWNDIKEIEYEEITNKKFYKIVNLFL
jgi:hypothetical protein